MDMELTLEKQRNAAFAEWPLWAHLEAWRRSYKGKRIGAGTPFLAPDGQLFIVTGRMFWRYAGSKRPAISLVWSSTCQVCQSAYTFNKPYHTRNLVRTCPSHRGKAHRAPKPLSRLQFTILATLDDPALRLIGKVDYESFYAMCAAQMPKPAGRDTRRQHVVRATQALIDRGLWPTNARLDDTHITLCD